MYDTGGIAGTREIRRLWLPPRWPADYKVPVYYFGGLRVSRGWGPFGWFDR